MKCRIVTDFPERFRPGLRLFGNHAEYHVQAARVQDALVYLSLQEVQDRTAAEALRGIDLLVSQADAVPLPEGEFYWHQVLGLRVEDTRGRVLGHVAEILETGANHVYVVRGPRGEILIPAVKDVVQLIEPASGRMVIDPLPGMLA